MKYMILAALFLSLATIADDSGLAWFDPGQPREGVAAPPEGTVTIHVKWEQPLLQIPSRFYGINIHPLSAAESFRNESLLRALKPDTMRIMLTGRTSWLRENGKSVVERKPIYPEPGVFDWAEIDALIDGVKKVGAEPYVTLGFGAPPWLNTANGPKFGLPVRADLPAYAQFKADFAELILKRHPELTMLAIENEPENVRYQLEDFLTLYRLSASAIRKSTPRIKIAGPATGYASWKQPEGGTLSFGQSLEKLVQGGADFDALDWHIYSTSPARIFGTVEVIREICGRETPLILSELNLDWRYSGSGGEEARNNNTSWYSAVHMTEVFDGLQRLGVERVYHFCLRNNFFGMYDYHFTKVHPVFHVFSAFTNDLGRERVDVAVDHPSVGAIATGDRRCLLVYNRSEEPVSLNIVNIGDFSEIAVYSEDWYEKNKELNGENFQPLPWRELSPNATMALPSRGMLILK